MLQNFLYLYKKKTHVVFFHFSFQATFTFRAFIKGKMKVARNEKRKKLLGFSFYINIWNFEAFLRNLNLSTKNLFWRCASNFLGNLVNQFYPFFPIFLFTKNIWQHNNFWQFKCWYYWVFWRILRISSLADASVLFCRIMSSLWQNEWFD